MTVPSYFKDFLSTIRLTDAQVSDLKTGHTTLRDRLTNHEDLADNIVSTFLQGSYRRSTAVRPKGDSRADVDIIVVTTFDKEKITPQEVLDSFIPFMEQYYKGKYRMQGRSIGIELSYVDLDIVPTSAPSESEKDFIKRAFSKDYLVDEISMSVEQATEDSAKEIIQLWESASELQQWKEEPLWIPDREAGQWDRTHPLEQIRWTREKNKNCNAHYVNVVKALKWWKKEKYPEIDVNSYPLEHLIGQSCPDGIDSVATGVTQTLEYIVNNHPTKPVLPDHGVQEHDVFTRITEDVYSQFYSAVGDAALLARDAYDEDDFAESVKKWRELFGNKFPQPVNKESGGLTPRTEKSKEVPQGRFA